MPAAATAARGSNPRTPRGPASMRRGGARTDRDGDVAMGAAIKGRARIGKGSAAASTPRDPAAKARKGNKPGGLSRGAKSAILKHVGADDVAMKTSAPKGDVEIQITGWEKSKISSHSDRGVSTLIQWLERKASQKLGSRKMTVTISKHRIEGTSLYITVRAKDTDALLRMNGYEWAGTNVQITRVGQADRADSAATADTKAFLRGVLERRYNPDLKLLDLSALQVDEGLRAKHVFDTKSTTGKIFPAMMKVLELCFDTEDELHAAIESVSLANNELPDLKMVTTMSETLPKLHNLDLSNNQFESLSALHSWRRRFYHLQQLVLSGNPIEQKEPGYPAEIMKWYPNLRTLNGVQVRTQEEIAKKSTVAELPFPIRSAAFQDEGGIAENFIRTFFVGFDSDRAQLASLYYDDQSDFSFSVNTAAPRDPSAPQQSEKQEWDLYIKNSRNLKKISQLPARQNRLFRGTKAVSDVFANFPTTRHPDLASDARKWMIEAHIQPGVPDPSGQSPNGVDGFLITVHGEFDQLDPTNGQSQKKRSFDRTFILGPGGPSGVRIVNDMMTVRAYGGVQAFEPDNLEGWSTDMVQQQQQQPAPPQPLPAVDGAPQLPAGLTVELAEQMVTELQKQTTMTVQYAKDCLEQVGWDFPKALEAFASVKTNLPPEAFMGPI